MTTIDFITALFCQVDDPLAGIPKHPHATLWPSEIVTLGILDQRGHLNGYALQHIFGDMRSL